MRSLRDRRASASVIVIAMVSILGALGILIPVALYVSNNIYSQLPPLEGTANTTAVSVRDSINSAFEIASITPLIVGAVLVVAFIAGVFVIFGRRS